MDKIFGANFRTTLTAIGTALFAALTFFSQVSYDQGPIALVIPAKYKPTVTWIAGICTLILWIWNGLAQKDKNVTGGTVQQTVAGNIAAPGSQSLVDETVKASIKSGEPVTPDQRRAVNAITPLLAALCIPAFLLSGCGTIAPGNDPVVVNAEKTTVIAADAFDTFLKSEYQTRDALKAASPSAYKQVHGYAEYLRAPVDDGSGNQLPRAKEWLQSARRLTVAYKSNRTADNKANLQTILDTITAAVAESQKYLLQLKK